MGNDLDKAEALRRETDISDLLLMAKNLKEKVHSIKTRAPNDVSSRLIIAADRISEACDPWERKARRPKAPQIDQGSNKGSTKALPCIEHTPETDCPKCKEAI